MGWSSTELQDAVNDGNEAKLIEILHACEGDAVSTEQLIANKEDLLELAARAGNITVLKRFFATKAVTQDDMQFLLKIAIQTNNSDMAALLVEHGLNIDQPNNFGRTPLHNAIIDGDIDTVAFLITQGAHINQPDKNGHTALHLAVVAANKDIAELLITKGTRINQQDINGQTALHLAVVAANKDIAELLITKGTRINQQDINGHTALHLAAYSGHRDIAELLINKGAEIDKMDKDGHTLLDLATINNHQEVIKLLQQHNAKTSTPDRRFYHFLPTPKDTSNIYFNGFNYHTAMQVFSDSLGQLEHQNASTIKMQRLVEKMQAIEEIKEPDKRKDAYLKQCQDLATKGHCLIYAGTAKHAMYLPTLTDYSSGCGGNATFLAFYYLFCSVLLFRCSRFDISMLQ